MTEEQTPMPVEVAPAPPDRLLEFRRALEKATPHAWVTPVLIAINVAIFVAMIATGVHILTPTTDALLKWGANYGPRTTSGEWWRLGSAMFLHIGIIHIAFNMVVLWDIGRFTERLLGNAGFLVVYVLSGLFGSLASVLTNPYVVSAGASGAVFGLYGVLLGFLMRNRASIPKEVLSKLQKNAMIFIGYNVLYGLSKSGIDMAAHIGGLASGFALGLAIAQPLTDAAKAMRWRRNLLVGVLGAALVGGVCVAAPRPLDLQAEGAKIDALIARMNDAAKKGDPEYLRVLEHEVLPEWRTIHTKLDGLKVRGAPETARHNLVTFMALRQTGWELTLDGAKSNDAKKIEAGHKKQAEADAFINSIAEKKDE